MAGKTIEIFRPLYSVSHPSSEMIQLRTERERAQIIAEAIALRVTAEENFCRYMQLMGNKLQPLVNKPEYASTMENHVAKWMTEEANDQYRMSNGFLVHMKWPVHYMERYMGNTKIQEEQKEIDRMLLEAGVDHLNTEEILHAQLEFEVQEEVYHRLLRKIEVEGETKELKKQLRKTREDMSTVKALFEEALKKVPKTQKNITGEILKARTQLIQHKLKGVQMLQRVVGDYADSICAMHDDSAVRSQRIQEWSNKLRRLVPPEYLNDVLTNLSSCQSDAPVPSQVKEELDDSKSKAKEDENATLTPIRPRRKKKERMQAARRVLAGEYSHLIDEEVSDDKGHPSSVHSNPNSCLKATVSGRSNDENAKDEKLRKEDSSIGLNNNNVEINNKNEKVSQIVIEDEEKFEDEWLKFEKDRCNIWKKNEQWNRMEDELKKFEKDWTMFDEVRKQSEERWKKINEDSKKDNGTFPDETKLGKSNDDVSSVKDKKIDHVCDIKVVCIESWSSDRPNTLKLKPGKKIKQTAAPNEHGLAYGYMKKGLFQKKVFGYYPVSKVRVMGQ